MKSIIFHILDHEKSYIGLLKGLLSGRCQTFVDSKVPTTATEYVMKCQQKKADAVVSTSETLLALVFPEVRSPKISDYAGTFVQARGIWWLFVPPLEQLFSVPYGKFVMQRYLAKVLAPEDFIVTPEFKYEIFHPNRLEYLTEFLDNCLLIAVDIETRINDPDRVISLVGFTGIQISGRQIRTVTVVVPMNEDYNVLVVQLWCSNSVPKVLQNGKYDIAYLLRYGAPITNYAFDTINLFHSWLSELPKDLGFISAFCLREYSFHKNDGKTGSLEDYYRYNAYDCFTTVFVCLSLLIEIPEYATKNFLMEFPLVFPCILSEHTGMKWNSATAEKHKNRINKEMELQKKKLQILVADPNYNPNSPQQTARLYAALGSKDVTSTDKIAADRVANRHPLNQIILDEIKEYREGSKLRGSYFKDSIPWNGRVYYALNPHGTDTGRLASKESQFWCGLQIQNIPRDGEDGDVSVKEAFEADDDFYFGEADFEQAESRGSGYISGDTRLIAAVDDETKDFHGTNASAFFGLAYEEIVDSFFDEVFDEWIHKTINKPVRQLSKNTNHGASYNMGPQVMLDTMGIKKVLTAKQLLNLPRHWTPLQVTTFLLERFSQTYKVLRNDYQNWVVTTVSSTGLLVGATGWTRRCFGVPAKSKRHLNSYVANNPQSLNAMILNQAYLKVFQNVYLPNPKNFKLCAQIHDSILFQYRRGHEHLVWQVADNMVIPTQVKDIFGVTRTLVVPVAVKGEGKTWSEVSELRRPKEFRKQTSAELKVA